MIPYPLRTMPNYLPIALFPAFSQAKRFRKSVFLRGPWRVKGVQLLAAPIRFDSARVVVLISGIGAVAGALPP